MKITHILLFIIALIIFPSLAAFAEDIIESTPTTASNSICVADLCLTGPSAAVLSIVSIISLLATFLIKLPGLQDQTKWYGKVLYKLSLITTKKATEASKSAVAAEKKDK